MTNLFTCDYVEYDKYGLKEVRCMASGDVIKSRMEEVSRLDSSRVVYVLGIHPEYREIPVLLADNTIAFIMVSDKYKDAEIGEVEADRITNQILRAKQIELESLGRPKEFIQAVLDNAKNKKRVLRRLTLEEVKNRFGGDK